MRHIADLVARSSLVDLASAARQIARMCQSQASRKYKSELRRQGVLGHLISLADELDSTDGAPVPEHGILHEAIFRYVDWGRWLKFVTATYTL